MPTVSGALGTPGFRNSAVMSLPPSWPQARDVRTTVAPVCEPGGELPGAVGVPPVGEPAMLACALR